MYEKSVGEILKEARERKKIGIDQVIRDTHMSKRLVIAMEEERFDEFVGDTYLVGFLRNYANYLEIDANVLLKRYHNLKIQEQQVPVDELLSKNPRRKRALFFAGGAVGVALIIIAAVFWQQEIGFASSSAAGRESTTEPLAPVASAPQRENHFPLTGEVLERRFSLGYGIVYELNQVPYYVSIDRIDSNVLLTWEGGSAELAPNQVQSLDINNDTIIDLTAELKEVVRNSGQAVLRFEAGVVGQPNTTTTAAVEINQGVTSIASRRRSVLDIGEVALSQPYQVRVVARAPTIVHYQQENQPRQEEILASGQEVTLQTNTPTQMWITNVGLVDFQINGTSIALGDPGQIRVFRLQKRPIPLTRNAMLQMVPFY